MPFDLAQRNKMAARLLTKVPYSRLTLCYASSGRTLSVGVTLSAKSKASADPVKQLFMDKIKEYQTQKDKSGKAPGMGAEAEQQLAGELDRLKTVYGGGDLLQFPNFDFKDTKIDWR